MVKAVVKYSDYENDERELNNCLKEEKVKVLKTKRTRGRYHRKIVVVDSRESLDKVVSLLRDRTKYGIDVLRVRGTFKLLWCYV